MITGLMGKVHSLEPTFVELEVGGVIYGVSVSVSCSGGICLGESIKLFITEIIREDSYSLFGFLDRQEQVNFDRLIKVNGVGPKVAMAILSRYASDVFKKIIEQKDIALLKKVPGVGEKCAGKIMMDLAGFFDISKSNGVEKNKEAILALEGLGFKKADIIKALDGISAKDTASIVKEALKNL